MRADGERELLERFAAAQVEPSEAGRLDELRAQRLRREVAARRRGVERWRVENPFPRGRVLFKAGRHDRWTRKSQAAGDAAAAAAKADFSRELEAAGGESADVLFARLAAAVQAAKRRSAKETAVVVRRLYTEHGWAVRRIVEELGLSEEEARDHVGLPPRNPPPQWRRPRWTGDSSGVDYFGDSDAGDSGGGSAD